MNVNRDQVVQIRGAVQPSEEGRLVAAEDLRLQPGPTLAEGTHHLGIQRDEIAIRLGQELDLEPRRRKLPLQLELGPDQLGERLDGWNGEGYLVVVTNRTRVEGGKGVPWQIDMELEQPVHSFVLAWGVEPPCYAGDQVWKPGFFEGFSAEGTDRIEE